MAKPVQALLRCQRQVAGRVTQVDVVAAMGVLAVAAVVRAVTLEAPAAQTTVMMVEEVAVAAAAAAAVVRPMSPAARKRPCVPLVTSSSRCG
jgi:hypothetical protein